MQRAIGVRARPAIALLDLLRDLAASARQPYTMLQSAAVVENGLDLQPLALEHFSRRLVETLALCPKDHGCVQLPRAASQNRVGLGHVIGCG